MYAKSMKKIPLSQGKFALVDDEDFERLSKYKWCLNNNYAGRRVTTGYRKSTIIYMHSVINGTTIGKDTDHINRNKLDNRRENLRTCSRSDNIRNTPARKDNKSGEKCIRFRDDHFRNFPWELRVKTNSGEVRKTFKTKEEAVEAYKEIKL